MKRRLQRSWRKAQLPRLVLAQRATTANMSRSRLQTELKKKPHLVQVASAALQILEALFSTSTPAWREETLHHVCKRWRVSYEKPKNTTGNMAAAVDAFANRKDIISLVAKSVVAADLQKKIVTNNLEEVSHLQGDTTGSFFNRRLSHNLNSSKKMESSLNSLPQGPVLSLSATGHPAKGSAEYFVVVDATSPA